MENNMTFRELCKRYNQSDSVSEKLRLSSEIRDLARNYLNSLYYNITKYSGTTKNTIFDGSDFRDDRGSLNLDDIWGDTAVFKYADSWGFGGSCNETFRVSFSEYEAFDNESHIKQMKAAKMQRIQREINALKNKIEALEKELLG